MRYLVSRGYVHVIADARDTGYSEGAYRVYSLAEPRDCDDLWRARQRLIPA
jgi:predicted acyl esterase